MSALTARPTQGKRNREAKGDNKGNIVEMKIAGQKKKIKKGDEKKYCT